VVALKLSDAYFRIRLRVSKQERRGGIETRPIARGRPRGLAKQERRGGIERSRSRALGQPPRSKQERRGGIETRPGSIENIWRYGKQERRGGIETALARFLSRQSLDIAAPPQRGIPRIG